MAIPSVSVLLPVRNGEPWLEASIASLSRQTLTDFELIVVDDGSTDGTSEILGRYAGSDRRIEIIHQGPLGLVAALNRGLARCRAPLVARMDADDVSHPRRLELQATLLEAHPKVGVASCLVQHFPRQRVAEGFRIYEAWLNGLTTHDAMVRERFVESPVAHPSVMVRREILAAAGGWRDAGWAEDYDLWLRLVEAGVRFAKVERPLFFWREHGDRLTRTDERYSVPSFLRCKAHHLARGPLARTDTTILWGAGQTGRKMVKFLRDEDVGIHRIVDIDPRKIGGTLRGVPVIAPEDLPQHLGGKTVLLAAVASRGARDLIRVRLVELGLEEGRTFWCVA